MTKILVTGAPWFIGANLAHRLVSLGADVSLFVQPKVDMWRLGGIKKKCAVFSIDLTRTDAVVRAVRRLRPDVVYHVATHDSAHKQEEAERMMVFDVLGTVNLLEALRHIGTAQRIVSVGSVTEYDQSVRRIREDTLLCASSAYGASKASQNFFTEYYARLYKMPIVIVRPTHLYGPFEDRRRLVPAAILAHTHGTPLALSLPNARRDYLFVEDAVDAFLAASKHVQEPGEIINIGSGKEYSNKEMVAAVGRCIGTRVPLTWGMLDGRAWDSSRRHMYDIRKAKSTIGWKPRNTLEEGLARTVVWFREHKQLYI